MRHGWECSFCAEANVPNTEVCQGCGKPRIDIVIRPMQDSKVCGRGHQRQTVLPSSCVPCAVRLLPVCIACVTRKAARPQRANGGRSCRTSCKCRQKR